MGKRSRKGIWSAQARSAEMVSAKRINLQMKLKINVLSMAQIQVYGNSRQYQIMTVTQEGTIWKHKLSRKLLIAGTNAIPHSTFLFPNEVPSAKISMQ
jgi:hypothetical protein